MGRRIGYRAATVQCALVLALFAFLALRPPAAGAMLVIPVGRTTEGALVNLALDAGAAPLGPGPMAGSVVVYGDRARLAAAIGRLPALLLAAPTILCGDPPATLLQRNAA